MEIADLARWTPIRFDFSGPTPTVDWADLSAERFDEPFFDQTVARWATSPGAQPLVRTGLDAFLALDSEPSLDPAGMIFHLSRCGSTLVSRLLGTLPGVVAIAEPSPLNALLGLDPDRVDAATLVQVVRLLVRALGRRRHGDEQHLVLKCTSWNIRRQEILAAAFPDTPWVWVQRDPAHVDGAAASKQQQPQRLASVPRSRQGERLARQRCASSADRLERVVLPLQPPLVASARADLEHRLAAAAQLASKPGTVVACALDRPDASASLLLCEAQCLRISASARTHRSLPHNDTGCRDHNRQRVLVAVRVDTNHVIHLICKHPL